MLYAVLYVLLIVLVNIGFTVTPLVLMPTGEMWPPMSLAVGLIFVLRDFVQRAIGHRVLLMMGIAAVLSYFMASPKVAFASVVAFAASELLDWAVYSKTRRPLPQRILLSSAVSTPIDSAIFLAVIGHLSVSGVAAMTASKMLGALVVWYLLRNRKPLVYLCGPINGRSDDDCKGWREEAKQHLPRTLDPMDRDYRGRELEPGIAKAIVENDKTDIDGCDVLLVYYDKPSVGTSMEVLYAWERGKVIVVVNRSDKPLSPWLAYHATKIVPSLGAALRGIL